MTEDDIAPKEDVKPGISPSRRQWLQVRKAQYNDSTCWIDTGKLKRETVPDDVTLNPVTGSPEIKPEITDPWTPPDVQIWSRGTLKARFSQVDESMSRPEKPWHSFQNPEDIKPGEKIYRKNARTTTLQASFVIL